ncbi:hypothetical protein ACWDBD_03130 [Streptomyces sp. NPDC001118]
MALTPSGTGRSPLREQPAEGTVSDGASDDQGCGAVGAAAPDPAADARCARNAAATALRAALG